jgi:hypothetical protein
VYKDLLAIPQEPKREDVQNDKAQNQTDEAIIHNVYLRLSDAEKLPEGVPLPITQALLQSRAQGSRITESTLGNAADDLHKTTVDSEMPYRQILNRLQEIIEQVETVQSSLFSSVETAVDSATDAKESKVPISLLAHNEWEGLVRVCVCVNLLSVSKHLLTKSRGSFVTAILNRRKCPWIL